MMYIFKKRFDQLLDDNMFGFKDGHIFFPILEQYDALPYPNSQLVKQKPCHLS